MQGIIRKEKRQCSIGTRKNKIIIETRTRNCLVKWVLFTSAVCTLLVGFYTRETAGENGTTWTSVLPWILSAFLANGGEIRMSMIGRDGLLLFCLHDVELGTWSSCYYFCLLNN